MLKIYSIILCFLFGLFNSTALKAQNIVQNPSFETINPIHCGHSSYVSEFDMRVINWHMANLSTADIFYTGFPQTCYGHPQSSHINRVGLVQPRTGEACTGMFTYGVGGYGGTTESNYREYISSKLVKPMVRNESYFCEYYVSHGDYSRYICNSLGMFLSDSIVQDSSYFTYNVVPQIVDTNIVFENQGWHQISDTIIASSNYNYVTLGNFEYDSTTNTIIVYNGYVAGGSSQHSYYFIDDVNIKRLSFNYTTDTTICVGTSAFLYARFDDFVGWSTSPLASDIFSTDSVFTVNPTMPTTYWCVGNDSTYSFVVDITELPTLELGTDTTICFFEDIELSVNNEFFNFVWEDGSSSMPRYVDTTGTFWLNAEHICGVASDTINTTYVERLDVDLGIDTTVCKGDTITLKPIDSYDNYFWSDGSTDSVLLVSSAGMYYLDVTYTCGWDREHIEIFYDSLPSFNIGNDTTLCLGENILFTLDSIYYNEIWMDTILSDVFIIDTLGLFWVEASHLCGQIKDTIYVDFYEPIFFDLGQDTVLCQGDTLRISLSNLNSILWSDGSTQNYNEITSSDLYRCVISDSLCSYSDSIYVDFIDLPYLVLSSDTIICNYDSIIIDASTSFGEFYHWNNGVSMSTVTVSDSGFYFCEVSNQCGSSYDSIFIELKSPPDFTLGEDTLICYGESFEIVLEGSNRQFYWSNLNLLSSNEIDSYGYHWVEVTENGCHSTDSIFCDTTLCDVIYILPNVFSPNNDGENDLYVPVEYKGVYNVSFQIFNRWGQLLYTSNNVGLGWDGRNFEGDILSNGVYYYIVSYSNVINEHFQNKGSLMIFH